MADTPAPDRWDLSATVELPSTAADHAPVAARNIEFVSMNVGAAGSDRQLLHRRLRTAATVLFVAAVAFLLQSLLAGDWLGRLHSSLALGSRAMFLVQAAHSCTLALAVARLWRRPQISYVQLRFAESIVFGATALMLVVLQNLLTLYYATVKQDAYEPAAMWLGLMFMYATYIPNPLRRAAIALGVLALLPVAGLVFGCLNYPVIAEVYTADIWSTTLLTLGVGLLAGICGVDTIGTLRKEADELKQLGQYRLLKRLGGGGMGEVFLAEHVLLKRPCAVKLIHPRRSRDPKAIERFEREVRATAKLTHWNTVEIYDFGRTDDGAFYYVMEHLRGLTLAELVVRGGPLPAERTLHLLHQICEALYEAHSKGLVHRDIKPGNIFVAELGGVYDVAKLLDFGLVSPQDAAATAEQGISGSPLYMAPEQARGRGAADARSDLYAIGGVAYFLLTGEPPFQANDALGAILAHDRETVLPPSQLRADVPADVERVVLTCLAKLPAERPQDALSLARALAACESYGRWTRQRAAGWWQTHAGAGLQDMQRTASCKASTATVERLPALPAAELQRAHAPGAAV